MYSGYRAIISEVGTYTTLAVIVLTAFSAVTFGILALVVISRGVWAASQLQTITITSTMMQQMGTYLRPMKLGASWIRFGIIGNNEI